LLLGRLAGAPEKNQDGRNRVDVLHSKVR
jgi:hypothetical protein